MPQEDRPVNIRSAQAIAGYAVNLSLIQIVSRTIPLALTASPLGDTSFNLSLPFSIGYIAAFFLLILRGLATYPMRRGAYAFTFVCLVFGGLISLVLPQSQAAALIGTTMLGLGSAFSFALWQQTLCYSVSKPLLTIMLGSALASLFWIPSFVLPTPGLVALLFVTILLDALLLWSFCPGADLSEFLGERPLGEQTVVTFVRPGTVRRLVSSLWRYVLCVATIGLTSRISKTLVQDESSLVILYITYSIGMILPALVLLAVRSRNFKMPSFNLAYSVFMLVTAVAFILLPFLGSEYRIAVAAVTYLAFSLASMFMVMTSVNVSKARDINPTLAFALFAFPVYIVGDAGPVLLQMAGGFADTLGISQFVVGSLFAIYCLSFTGVLLGLSKKNLPLDADIPSSPAKFKDPAVSDPSSDLSDRFSRDIVIKQDLIPLCCEAIEAQYGLTERQTEVLELIARGRDVTRIADALCVSYHTAKSHCRNLYIKLDVHSKQEILDLLEKTKASL